jgi:hypothetical protein
MPGVHKALHWNFPPLCFVKFSELEDCDPMCHLGQSRSPIVSISSGLWTLLGSRRYWHQFLMQFNIHAVVKGFGCDLI